MKRKLFKIICVMFSLFVVASCNKDNENDKFNSQITNSESEVISTYSISGTITDENDNGINEVTINLKLEGVVIATQTTDETGTYAFSDLENGTYYIEIFKTPYVCESIDDVKLIVRDKNVLAEPIVLIKENSSWGDLQ